MKLRWLIFSMVSLLWGSEWIFAMRLADFPRFRLLALRYLVATVLLVPWVLKGRLVFPSRLLLQNVLFGFVVIVIPALFLGSRPNLSSGIVVLLFAILPMITSIIESGSGLASAPLLLGGLAGTAFLVRGSLSFALSQALPFLALLLIVAATALMLVRGKLWLAKGSLPMAVLVQMVTAALSFGAWSLFAERGSSFVWMTQSVVYLLCLGLLSAASYFAFYWLITETTVSRVTVLQWTTPAVSIAGTAVWLRHLPNWDAAFGGGVSIACAILFFRETFASDDTLTLQITTDPNRENAHLNTREP